jgi:superfamily II DNA or RNA helicase
MLKITIGNSVCRIVGLKQKSFQALRDCVSVQEQTGRWIEKPVLDANGNQRFVVRNGQRVPLTRRGPEIRTRYMIDKRGDFPTGLLYLVEDFLREHRLGFEVHDTRVVPKLGQISDEKAPARFPFEPYNEQLEAAAAAVEWGRGIVVGPTGVGKSGIAGLICDAFRVPTLVVVPSVELRRQLTASLREIFGARNVGPLSDSGEPLYFISVENVDGLNRKKRQKGINLVLIDEFHHSGAMKYRELNRKAWADIYYKIGLTATPFRSKDTERLLLESVLSQVIYRIPYKTAVKKGYIVPLEVYYYDLPVVKPKRGSAGNFHSVYSQLVVEREDRNDLIAYLTSSLRNAGCSTLVLTKQIEHGLKLQDALRRYGVDDVPFVKGENDDNREVIGRFSSGKIPALIGTTGVVGEGVDTKAAEWVFLAGGGKSKNAFMQQVGRVFRRFGTKESGKVVMFRDASNPWLLDHFEACVRYLRDEYGVEPVKLELP